MKTLWKSIDTAPYDQDMILAGTLDNDNDWRIKIGHRDNSRHSGFYIYGASWNPKYWMPLPEEPTNA